MDRGKLGSEFVSHQVFESLTRRWGRWLVMYADHYSQDSGAKILLHHQMWTRVPWFSHWYFLQPPTMAFVCLEYDKRRQIVCSSRFLQWDGHNCILHNWIFFLLYQLIESVDVKIAELQCVPTHHSSLFSPPRTSTSRPRIPLNCDRQISNMNSFSEYI